MCKRKMSLAWFFFSFVLGAPTDSPTFADPTSQPTYEWGPWGDCIDCSAALNVPSRYNLPPNVCGCRESNRTCEKDFADYDCTSSGVEVRVDSCDVDGLTQEITCVPTERPTYNPSKTPSQVPTVHPTNMPISFVPTATPTYNPTTRNPTTHPTSSPIPNTEGQVVLEVGIIFHGWPQSKIVAGTLLPLSRVIKVDAEVIDVISANHTTTSPYTMSVQYKLYLMNNHDAEDVAWIIDSAFFGTDLSENIWASWGKPSVSLTVSKAYHSFVGAKGDSQMNAWAIAFLTFGCSVLLTITLIGVLVYLRQYYKRQFHKEAEEYGALLNQKRKDLGGYEFSKVELIDNTKSDDLLQQPMIVEGSGNNASPPVQIKSPLNKTRSIVETFSEIMGVKQQNLEQQKQGGIFAAPPQSWEECSHKKRKSEVIRQDHHQFRKHVLRRIKSSPIKVSHTFTGLIQPQRTWGFGPTDEGGNVMGPLGNSGDLKSENNVDDTKVTLEELGSRREDLKQSSLEYFEDNQGKSRES